MTVSASQYYVLPEEQNVQVSGTLTKMLESCLLHSQKRQLSKKHKIQRSYRRNRLIFAFLARGSCSLNIDGTLKLYDTSSSSMLLAVVFRSTATSTSCLEEWD